MSESDGNIQEVRQILLSNLRPDEQWRSIQKILATNSSAKEKSLSWLLTNREGYVEVRVHAGAELLNGDFQQAWRLIEGLIRSDDPDDRDTAVTLLSQNPSQPGYELARPLLEDPWPYLRLEAVEYLKHAYPLEVRRVLSELEQHNDEWVRISARKLLESLS